MSKPRASSTGTVTSLDTTTGRPGDGDWPGRVPAVVGVDPMMFSEPGVPCVGEFAEQGWLELAVEAAIDTLASMNRSFSVPALSFLFNGTPGLVRFGDEVPVVVADWSRRREVYQRAAGII